MSSAIALPASLNRQFASLERWLWRGDAIVSVAGALSSLLIAFALQFISDRIWDTPHWLRFFFALAGWAGVAFFAWRYGSRWIWGRRSVSSLARIVQKRYRRLGDRLLGIVELANPAARPSSYSPELCTAAIAQVAGEASSFDFNQAVDRRLPTRYGIAAGILVLIVLQFFIVRPAGINALYRWLWPMANIERYTFVTLNALPDHLVVPQGEPFDISVGLAPASFWHPSHASSHFDGQSATEAPIHDGAAQFHLPGQTQKRTLFLSVGDVTRSMLIDPEIRPDLRQVTARIILPDYLQYPPQDQHIDGGSLAFLPGSTVTFTGEAVRDLASASLMGGKPTPLPVNGPSFHTAPMLLELERDVTFTWCDSLGLAGASPMSIHLAPREDSPPGIEVRGLEAAIGILPEETVPIDLAATDDFGVRSVTFSWQTAAPTPMDPPGPIHEIKLADGNPRALTLGGHYDFSALLLQIPEDTTVLVRGEALDYFPYREPSSSPIYRIHVLSRETHAQLIHDQFEKLLAELEDLSRRQEVILQSGKAVRSQSPDKLASDESAQKLAAQSGDQKETAAQLKNLAANLAQTLAEALRNPSISPDTLKEWANHAQQLNAIAASSMPAAAQSLDSARADSTQRPSQLDQAIAQEQAILKALRDMERNANDSLESLAAQTLAARLRRAAATERDIGAKYQSMIPETVGMTRDQLPQGPRDALDAMIASNTGVTSEADRLQHEISRLFDRTNLTRYGDVASEMDSLKTVDALTALGVLIQKNIGVYSIDSARRWSDQFNKWADRISAKDDSKSPPGTPGQPDPAQMKALLALMRLRQQQDQLRQQTAALDEQKTSSPNYTSAAQDAASRQGAMRDQVQSMQQDPSSPVPPAKLAPIGKSMADAAGLLAKPETGPPTTNAQTDAVNLLDAVIDQMAKSSGQSAASLMAMMGMGIGGSGSGSTSGGTTNKANVQIPGSRDSAAPDQRTVIQAGGGDNSPLPGEFRDAIESYQHSIEKNQSR
jgi:hypothetical protein